MTEVVVLMPGGKEEFMEWISASSKTNHWMHCYNDYECYRNMLAGEYVGSCMGFKFPDYTFIAAYYVRPEFRNRGIGAQLFKLVANDDVRKKNVGLHASPAMTAVYQAKLGFNIKLSWLANRVKISEVNFSKLSGLASNFMVKDIKEVSLEQLVEYDMKIAKCNRKPFVRSWIYDRRDAVSKVVLNSNNEIVGYGSAHLFSIWDSPAFCPIYGDSDQVFGAIFYALANHFKEQIECKNLVDLRMPTGKVQAVKMILEGIADVEVPEAETPMFTKSIPEHDVDKIYSITGLTMFF